MRWWLYEALSGPRPTEISQPDEKEHGLMSLRKRLLNGWLVLLKHSLNRLTRRMARGTAGPFALVQHVGRRSGRAYETPIIVRPVPGGFVAELTYGPAVDWYQNVTAAGGCTIVWHGRVYRVTRIEPMPPETGLAAFSAVQRAILRRVKPQHFMKLVTGAPAAT
jgi:deazaflavin-dependent oxidoreductase (nitroreductase family)